MLGALPVCSVSAAPLPGSAHGPAKKAASAASAPSLAKTPTVPAPKASPVAVQPAPAPSPKGAPAPKAGGLPKAPAPGPAKKPTAQPSKKPAKTKGSQVSNKPAKKAGSTPGAPDTTLRAAIAGEEPSAAKIEESPELSAIKEVDDVLFPDVKASEQSPITGSRTGGSRDHRSKDGVSVYSTGLPPTVQLGTTPAQVEETTDFAWLSKLNKPDLPFRWDPRLVRYLDYFKNSPKGRAMVSALLKRSGRYVDPIQRALRASHMPEDIAWLALVESGMNPRIASHAGAAGLWQFMPKAGTAYGLRIDRYVDERLDPERSTQAALRYLTDLHTRFGRWELALAAYNMGHGGLLTAIRKYNTNDYWELSQFESGVPYETALYVPKIVALAFVARNRAVFGCDNIELDAAEPFDTVSVAPGVSVESVAGATGVSERAILALNPQLLGTMTPPRLGATAVAFPMRVPAGTRALAEAKLPRAAESDLDRVTLRWGESLESVALAHGTTESKLRALNGLGSPVPPRPGTDLLVPQPAQKVDSKVSDPVVAVVPAQTPALPNRRHVLYEVVWGDALDDVARVLGVSSDELCIWNNVDPSARLHGKMVLQAFVPRDKKLDEVRLLDAKQARLLTVGSPEFFNYFEAKNGRSRQTITVKKGDSWAGLAKKHGLSIGQLERINQRSHYTRLEDGEQLVVYTRRTDAPTRSPATTDDTLYAASASDGSDAPGPLTPELSSPPPTSPN